MVSWSSILTRARNPVRSLVMLNKTPFLRSNVSLKVPVRNSHGEDMWIRPTRYNWELFKDYLHFYSLLGLIPLGGLLLYCNIFIGPAQLAEIPEGYTPKEWEYYEHPFTRFLAYIIPSDQEKYERMMHYLFEHMEKKKYDETIKKVKDLQKERQDFMAWYYEPNIQGRYLKQYLEERKELLHKEHLSTPGGVFR